MFVRSVRFVLLLLLVVAAFGASAVRAHAAAEVRNEELSTTSSQSESTTQVSNQQTVIEDHSSDTQTTLATIVETGGEIVHTSAADQPTKPADGEITSIVQPSSTDSTDLSTHSANATKQYMSSSTNMRAVLAAESQTTPVQLQPTSTAQTTPHSNTPVSTSSNPLMVLLSATSNAIFTISGSQLHVLSVVVPLGSSYMLLGLVLTSLMTLFLASIVVTYLKRMGFAHGARSNPATQVVGIIQFAKSSSNWLAKQDSVFSYLVSNKIMKLHNVGGIL